uniref:NMDA receptor synaptonuclear signaling and neuronal migration factor n=1 Tax=Pseudonaja textilis TaxID=8673 RepID=A0A670ZD60_PSETE
MSVIKISILGVEGKATGLAAARAFGDYLSQNHPEGKNGADEVPIRTWLPKENLFTFQTATTTMQAAFRGYAERKRRKRENDSATLIQRYGGGLFLSLSLSPLHGFKFLPGCMRQLSRVLRFLSFVFFCFYFFLDERNEMLSRFPTSLFAGLLRREWFVFFVRGSVFFPQKNQTQGNFF